MADNVTHTGLGVALRKVADGQMYEFGVVVNGRFIGFGARKAGDVDEAIAEGQKDEAAAAAQTTTPTTNG